MSDALARAERWLPDALGLPPGAAPFPWQRRLLGTLVGGDLPTALDLPTGLGKTSVIALWLLARAVGAPLPRRMVYVVDRRVVVDQATAEAERLRAWVAATAEVRDALALGRRELPISTLRGQHVDNREWLEDPSAPAVVVGTVDMVGSRLLFSGYGVSSRMRPYQAGLLGRDTLLVLDEAHLVPPFEALVTALAGGEAELGPRGAAPGGGLRRLSLSATARRADGEVFRLDDADLADPVVRQRVDAPKRLSLRPDSGGRLADGLAGAVVDLLDEVGGAPAVLAYCDLREDAEMLAGALRKRLPAAEVELFVGARRVAEREAARRRLGQLGFLAGGERTVDRPRVLVATAAAEVGVDLDADHLVADVVAWERLVQRLGRVNRRGGREARVVLVETPSEPVRKAMDAAPSGPAATRRTAVLSLVRALPLGADGRHDASPAALRTLADAAAELVTAATSPPPLHPALDRPTVEAWAMTSVAEHPGRPSVAPWLRGWVDEEPQTRVVWRARLPSGAEPPLLDPAEEARWFDAMPPHTSELLETESYRVAAWLLERADAARKSRASGPLPNAADVAVAWALDGAGTVLRRWSLSQLAGQRDRFESALAGRTLVVDARLGGLRDGLLAPDADEPPPVADGDTPWLGEDAPPTGFRVRLAPADAEPTNDPGWRERARFAWRSDVDGEVVEWLVVDRWQGDATTEDDRSAGRPQALAEHQAWTEARARRLGQRLGLDPASVEILAIAAALHDEGKRAARWQRAMRAKEDAVYAKTLGPMNSRLLDGYRHEFGSLRWAEADPRVRALPSEARDLVLHLVAAHHGGARPTIETRGCDDAPPSALEARARDVALRYFRLQERWGPWGLAWWEALLRAADQQASRDNDRGADDQGGA